MKCSRAFWKNQFNICIATTIPFVGMTFLEIGTENRIQGSYEVLVKPSWSPNNYWVSFKKYFSFLKIN
jgi:hypothetical protein